MYSKICRPVTWHVKSSVNSCSMGTGGPQNKTTCSKSLLETRQVSLQARNSHLGMRKFQSSSNLICFSHRWGTCQELHITYHWKLAVKKLTTQVRTQRVCSIHLRYSHKEAVSPAQEALRAHLGYGDGLLLHSFMDGYSIILSHLLKKGRKNPNPTIREHGEMGMKVEKTTKQCLETGAECWPTYLKNLKPYSHPMPKTAPHTHHSPTSGTPDAP